MRVLLVGGSGMIGQAVLRELLTRAEVTRIVAIGRSALGANDSKVEEVVRKDLHDWSDAGALLSNVDAVLWCLGVSSGGMSEADYTRVTYALTMDFAKALSSASPQARFVFISGSGADGDSMWARVKRQTEDELRALGFKSFATFRPGYIQPMDGIESKTPAYKWMYVFSKPLYPLIKGFTKYVTSSRQLAFAMVEVALKGSEKTVFESADFNAVK
ncbi:MAG: NAD(P)H-binding protein [Archangium sp.]